ncbi:MAG: hypothetical protein JWM78_929 [Verrucomicrobiaceae bacterium]|nr:hypothetical protein [Verrucomicrobiaceae bacterium]
MHEPDATASSEATVKKSMPGAAGNLTPEQRLQQSRQRLRDLLGVHEAAVDSSEYANASARRKRQQKDSKNTPHTARSTAVQLSGVLVRDWWHRHPWRSTLRGATKVAGQLSSDAAEYHPMRLVAGAAAAGAVIAWVKPWRLLSHRTLVRGAIVGAGAGVKAGGGLNASSLVNSIVQVVADNLDRAEHRKHNEKPVFDTQK